MITIQVDLVKYGIYDPEMLKYIRIWNDGTGDHYTGNYGYEISDARGRVYRKGTIEGFKRKSNDVLTLLSIVLKQEGYGN